MADNIDKRSTWWRKDTVAVVTGANKGIGLEIVRQLARNGVTTILTARNEGRGQSAVSLLKAEGLQNVDFYQLEVTDLKSVEDFAAWLKLRYSGLDILINNAGIHSLDYTDKKQGARDVIDTNYYGVKNVTKELLPLIRTGGRIVNVSSRLGQLQTLNRKDLKQTLSSEEHLSENLIDLFVNEFLAAVNKGEITKQGWPTVDIVGTGPESASDYSVSKIALNAYTKLLAFQLSGRVHINSFCPGYTQTDMTGGLGDKTVKEGADTGVWLALLPPSCYDLPSGKFFGERVQIPF
ncbi:hypothetical protein O6H91_15G069600 [Diphasiastrum complanatum]|uniref:Uncharacterized protein n=1 Tax=Diphasiastrum complanatum TaxID=34168 RepID=A0ACC2BK70_DIPCM|nr:hypothetical protein O6H91_15G069600 [Diphasiastrum complanatum]